MHARRLDQKCHRVMVWDVADGLQERESGEACGEEIERRFIAEIRIRVSTNTQRLCTLSMRFTFLLGKYRCGYK